MNNISKIIIGLLIPVFLIPSIFWLSHNFPLVEAVLFPLQDIKHVALVYIVIFFTWPSVLCFYYLEARVRTKLLVCFLFYVFWGPVLFAEMIVSVMAIANVYP